MVYMGICIVLAVFLGDLWIKNRVEKKIGEKETREVFHGRILIRKHHNRGGMLNFAENWKIGSHPESKITGQRMIAALSFILCFCLTIVYICSFTTKGSHLLRIGLSLLLGGAFSNTYDRLKRKYVVDYFSFVTKWKALSRIIFNVSDFCIMIGACLCVIASYRK